MKFLILTSILFCANTHPIALIIILITSTLLLSALITFFLKSSWLSLIFILIMLGGMLILFIYIASLASNESFMVSKIIYLTPAVLLLPPYNYDFHHSIKESNLMTMFSTTNSANNFLAISYLLMTLLVVIEIISSYKLPLRSSM